MQKRKITKIVCLTLTLILLVSLCGCGSNSPSPLSEKASTEETKPEESITPNPIESNPIISLPATADYTGQEHLALADFSVRLFQACNNSDANTLISPTSVLYALTMTANGAKGDTLSQMENAFGLPVDTLNPYLSTYLQNLPSAENYKLHIANSIWVRNAERFTVEQDFLQTNTDYYDARVFQVPFDKSTVKEINDWVHENTDGMIPKVLDDISPGTVMYLINALSFDAKWQETYWDYQVRDDVFTTEDGTSQEIELMHSTESDYLEDENATGFLKYYRGKKYAFAALLPKEGGSVTDYVSSLTGEQLYELLSKPQSIQVEAAIPKYETEYSLEMRDALQAMGISNAFDETTADFSGIGSSTAGNLFINSVLHKTFLAVNEEGTKASAATVVEVSDSCALIEPEEIKIVHLDRPFVYMLIDCETNLPIFMGTVMNIEQ